MSERPNLLLITTDQQRGDCLGCDGHPALETPYLDELAERGAHFPHAYIGAVVYACTRGDYHGDGSMESRAVDNDGE